MDLGLPSGTLWLDRLVGAQSPTSQGLYYQWGDIIGHTLADHYPFSYDNYVAKRLNLITSDLDEAHDAARAYYGPIARIPSNAQMEELINNCVISIREGNLTVITSSINGKSITIPDVGHIEGYQLVTTGIRAWSRQFYNASAAYSLHIDNDIMTLGQNARTFGIPILAVHS